MTKGAGRIELICLTPLCDDVDNRELCVVRDVDVVLVAKDGWAGFNIGFTTDMVI